MEAKKHIENVISKTYEIIQSVYEYVNNAIKSATLCGVFA